MIVKDLSGGLDVRDNNGKDVHELIEESITTYPTEVEQVWRAYSVGDMRDLVSHKRKSDIGVSGLDAPLQNMIRMCLRQIVGRIRFKRFLVDDEEKQGYLDDYAVKNSMTRLSVGIARRALIDGNTAISQSWSEDSGRVITRQEYWLDTDGKGIFVAVDDTNDPVWAVSDYIDNDEVSHRILYLEDRIVHYIEGSGAEGWRILSEDEFLDADGNPIGVPVSHFPNADPDYGPYGSSTVREVLSIQDSLNLNLFNRQAVSAMTGQQLYWASGIKTSDAPDTIGPGIFITADDPSARFGAIPPGGIDGILHETDDLRGIISGAFPVPSYRLGSGQWPSGLALQRSDGPMITSVRLLRDVIEPGLVGAAHRATVMSNAFGGTDFNLETMISVEFEPIDDIDPSTESEIHQSRVDAISGAESLTKAGMRKTGMFTEAEIEDIVMERDAMDRVLADVGDEDLV